jgi:hypothetical protein
MADQQKGFPSSSAMGDPIPGEDYVTRNPGTHPGRRYVVIGGGSQLAIVERPERKWRQDGYRLSPLNNGAGDGWGYTVWYPARQVDAAAAVMSEWEYYPRANQWRKVNRRVVRERWAAEQTRLAGEWNGQETEK